MSWSVTYILSQVLTVVEYGLLGLSYLAKRRVAVVILDIVSMLTGIVVFILLGAVLSLLWTVLPLLRPILVLLRTVLSITITVLTLHLAILPLLWPILALVLCWTLATFLCGLLRPVIFLFGSLLSRFLGFNGGLIFRFLL